MIQSQPQMVGSNLFVVLMWMTYCIQISYIHILCTSLCIYIYIYLYNIISNDAWYFLWGPSFLSSSIPLAEWPPGPPGQVHEGGTAQPGKLLRRDGIRADEGGVAAASTDGIPWLLVCWSWRWIGKFKNPTVGIEENSLSLFFKILF